MTNRLRSFPLLARAGHSRANDGPGFRRTVPGGGATGEATRDRCCSAGCSAKTTRPYGARSASLRSIIDNIVDDREAVSYAMAHRRIEGEGRPLSRLTLPCRRCSTTVVRARTSMASFAARCRRSSSSSRSNATTPPSASKNRRLRSRHLRGVSLFGLVDRRRRPGVDESGRHSDQHGARWPCRRARSRRRFRPEDLPPPASTSSRKSRLGGRARSSACRTSC